MKMMLRRLALAGCAYGILGGPVTAVAQPSILSPDSELGPYVVQATLTPDGVSDDRFGRGVAFVNDTVLVAGTGVIYVFERTPGTDVWQERAPLTPPGGVMDDVFGNSMAFVNETVLVSGTGVVYVFERTPGSGIWQGGAPLTPAAPVEGFGTSFAFDGQRAIVGVHGAAVLFRRSGPGAWHQVAVLAGPDLDPDSSPSVSIDGDTATVAQHLGLLPLPGPSSSTFVFSRRDSQPESWEMSLVVTELPNFTGDSEDAVLAALQHDTLIFSVRGIGVGPLNRLYFFVRDVGGSGQWEAVQSMTLFLGGLLALDDSRVVVVAGEPTVCCMAIYRRNRDVNRWVLEAQLTIYPLPGSSISGDIMFLRGQSSASIAARNQGGENAWRGVNFLRPARPPSSTSTSLVGTISGDTVALLNYDEHAVLILASDIDRDGLRDGVDACPRDPQNNVAGGCARDGAAYLVLDHLIALGDVTTETIGDELHITATFTNSSDTAIGNPFFEVAELTGGNVLVNGDAGPGGTGATLSPDVGDGILSPGEPTTVTFVIGLETREAFRFFVSVKGEPSQ